MKRTLILLLWAFWAFHPQAHAAIEIDSNGHRYASFQAYQSAEKAAASPQGAVAEALNNGQEDFIRQQAKQLGIDVDFSKVKTFRISRSLSDKVRHKLYILGVEHGVVKALNDFFQAQGSYLIPITSRQLQEIIRQEVSQSPDPKLLIASPGKLRIMSLTAQK